MNCGRTARCCRPQPGWRLCRTPASRPPGHFRKRAHRPRPSANMCLSPASPAIRRLKPRPITVTSHPKHDRSQATPHVDASERLLASILEALPSERHDMVCDLVRDEVMRVLRCDRRQSAWSPRSTDGSGTGLFDGGATAGPARAALRRRVALPVTLMFDHPTIDALASYLCDQLAAPEPPTATPSESARLIASGPDRNGRGHGRCADRGAPVGAVRPAPTGRTGGNRCRPRLTL